MKSNEQFLSPENSIKFFHCQVPTFSLLVLLPCIFTSNKTSSGPGINAFRFYTIKVMLLKILSSAHNQGRPLYYLWFQFEDSILYSNMI